jgi:hypothetical protein
MSFNQKRNGKTFVTLGDSITYQDGKPYIEGPEKVKRKSSPYDELFCALLTI